MPCLKQLLAQHHGAFGHAHHVAVEEADVLGFIALGDQAEEIELGANLAAASTHGLAPGHLHLGEVGVGGYPLGGADRVEDGREQGG